MTPTQINLVQSTWRSIESQQMRAASLFYQQLFTADPALIALFTNDLNEQKHKLVATIGVAVEGLDRLETLAPFVRDLGRRHVGYGAQAAHYATVGTALLATLEQTLGSNFTPEVREAWRETYTLLANTMQDAAAQTPAAAAD